jgi:hypothetical protein
VGGTDSVTVVDVTVRLTLADVMAQTLGRAPHVIVLHSEVGRDGRLVSPTGKRITPESLLPTSRSLGFETVGRADEVLIGNPTQGWMLYKTRRFADHKARGLRVWP